MKLSKNFPRAIVLAITLFFPVSIFCAAESLKNIQTALYGQILRKELSEKACTHLGLAIKGFLTNQKTIANNFQEIIKENLEGSIVDTFNIPAEQMQKIREKLRPYTDNPVFYRPLLDDDPIPQFEVFTAFKAIGFTMNKAAEKAFKNPSTGERASGAKACATKDNTVTTENFNRAQMKVLVEHECCHVKNEDQDLRVLFRFLTQNKEHFSAEEFSKIMGAFGEDFLSSRKALIDAITRDAQEMGIYDFDNIEDFDIDLTAFIRYYETRVDKTILASKDKMKIKAYRDYYQNRSEAPELKKREEWEKANVKKLLQKGQLISSEIADFTWPTDQERVAACEAALAELDEAASATDLCSQLSLSDGTTQS